MRTNRRVLTNTVALAFSTGIQRLSAFLLALYIARVLGAESLGEFSVVMSMLLIFQTVSSLGQQQIIIREVARAPEEAGRYFVNGSLIAAVGGLISMLLMIITANLINYGSDVVKYAYVASLSLVPGALAIVGESVIQGREQMRYVTLAWAIGGAIKLSLGVILLQLGVGLWSVFFVLVLANSAIYVSYLRVMRHLKGHLYLSIDHTMIRHLIGLARTFIIISIFGVVFKQIDVLMLGKLRDSTTVGIYAAGFRLVQIGMILLPAFLLALFPRMAEAYAHSPGQLAGIAEQALKLLMALVIPTAIIVTVLADQIVFLFYGPGYRESASVLQILIWMLVIFVANAVLFRSMLASDNERITLRVAGVNMLVSVALNVLLIPRWGAYGVAVASLFTTLIALLQNYYYAARHLFRLNWLHLIGKPILAAAPLGGMLIAFQEVPIALSLSIGIGLYCAAAVGLRIISANELDFVRHAWTDAKARISP